MFRLRMENRDRVPRKGGVLVASNHVSHLDPPLVGISVPRFVQHMAKKELFKVPLLTFAMMQIKTILVHRGKGKQALLDAMDYIKQGSCVVIFPEGTRSKSGRLMKGHSGAIVIAIRTGCDIVPAAIMGSEKAMTKGSILIKPVKVVVRFGEPYKIEYSGDIEKIPRDVLERETYRMMEKIEELLPENMKAEPELKAEWYANVHEAEGAQA